MEDTIPTDTADALLDAFAARAEDDFRRRMSEVENRTRIQMSHELSREVLPAILAMDPMRRWQMFRGIMHCTDGAETLDGMESVLHFVGYHLMDDGGCHLEPYVPDAQTQDVYRESTNACHGEDLEQAGRALREWLMKNAEWNVVAIGEDADGRTCTSAEIVDAIRRNEALHDAEDAWRSEAFDADENSSPSM